MKYHGRYLIQGHPGCGKTTFLARQVGEVVKDYSARRNEPGFNFTTPCLVVSLTKAAAAEIGGRDLNLHARSVGTLHSLCFHALGEVKVIDQALVKAFNLKSTFKIPEKEFPQSKKEDPTATYVKPKRNRADRSDPYFAYHSYEHARQRLTNRGSWTEAMIKLDVKWKTFKEKQGVVDFTDLIEHAMLTVSTAPGQPYVIICDEAQDLSFLEYELLKAWEKNAAALILAGDQNQMIYGFRGSCMGIFDDPHVPEERRKTLKRSYRVPREVIQCAGSWLRAWFEEAPTEYAARQTEEEEVEGEVKTMIGGAKQPGRTLKDAIKVLETEKKTAMVVALCEYLISPTVKWLKDAGVPFSNPWRKKNYYWNPFGVGLNRKLSYLMELGKDSERIMPPDITRVKGIVDTLDSKKTMRKGAKKQIDQWCDQDPEWMPRREDWEAWFKDEFALKLWDVEATCEEIWQWWFENRLQSKIKESTARYLIRVYQRWGLKGLNDPPRVFVGTVHSVKGGEADRVYFFTDTSRAQHRAIQQWGGEECEELVRTAYVAMTRARESLTFSQPTRMQCLPVHKAIGYRETVST
jgi:superfamily I DNA/RNA helicase